MNRLKSNSFAFQRKKPGLIIGAVAVVMLLLLVFQISNVISPMRQPKELSIKNIEEIGLVQNPVRPQFIRDGGAGAVVDGKYLWTFGDTLFNPKSVDGVNGRTATAGYAELNNPLSVSEPLDINQAPAQFIPLSQNDQAYNNRTKKGDDRYAIWPGLVVARPEQNDALVFFLRLKVNPGGGGLNYDLLNTGIARVPNGSTQAEVIVPELFKKPEPLYSGPGFTKDGFIYFYECSSRSERSCSLARVKIEEVLQRANYAFWDGKSWQSDFTKRAEKYPGTSTGTSIGYIPAINQYVIFYNKPFSKDMYVSTSQELGNGWSKPKKFYEATANNYALLYHPELTTNNGTSLLLTYYQPRSGMRAIRLNIN